MEWTCAAPRLLWGILNDIHHPLHTAAPRMKTCHIEECTTPATPLLSCRVGSACLCVLNTLLTFLNG